MAININLSHDYSSVIENPQQKLCLDQLLELLGESAAFKTPFSCTQPGLSDYRQHLLIIKQKY
eukprot:Pgem_evm1s9015